MSALVFNVSASVSVSVTVWVTVGEAVSPAVGVAVSPAIAAAVRRGERVANFGDDPIVSADHLAFSGLEDKLLVAQPPHDTPGLVERG